MIIVLIVAACLFLALCAYAMKSMAKSWKPVIWFGAVMVLMLVYNLAFDHFFIVIPR